jgi:ABC-type transport system involved in Fe-S cluster assembly fused permease/ATPase subunit
MVLELVFVLAVIGYIYPIEFFGTTFACVVVYIIVTVVVTEWRAKYFKTLAVKDTAYN